MNKKNIHEAIKAIELLISKASELEDCGADDGDGRFDTWQSYELADVIRKAEEAIQVIKNHN